MTNTFKRRLKAAGLAGAAGVLVLLALALALHAYGRSQLQRLSAEFEQRLGPLEPGAHERPSVPDSRNAARLFLRGADSIAWDAESKELVGRTGRGLPLADWSPGDREAVEAFLFANRAAVADLLAAAVRPESDHGVDLDAPPDPPLETLVGLVRAARLLKAEARLAFEANDAERTLQATAAIGRLAESLQREPTLIHALIGTACEHARLSVVREIVASGTQDSALLRALEAQIPVRPTDEMVRELIAAEGSVVAAMARGDIVAKGEPLPRRLLSFGDLPEADAIDLSLRVLDFTTEPLAEMTDTTAPVTRTVWTPWGDAWTGTAIPNWRMALGRIRGAGAIRELARVALRLRIERLESDPAAADAGAQLALPAGEAFLGLPLLVTPSGDGSLRLELAGAPELWAGMVRNVSGEIALSWRVP